MKPVLPLACTLWLVACTDTAATADATADEAPQAHVAAAPRPDAAACRAGEDTVFACRGARGGEVAICASEALSADAGHLRYRETGRWQVEHPAADEPAARAFRSGTLMYSGGGGAFVRFDRQGETYTVYTGIGRGWEKAGVQVRAGERVVRAIACEGEVESELGPALFARAGLPDDPEGFEIP